MRGGRLIKNQLKRPEVLITVGVIGILLVAVLETITIQNSNPNQYSMWVALGTIFLGFTTVLAILVNIYIERKRFEMEFLKYRPTIHAKILSYTKEGNIKIEISNEGENTAKYIKISFRSMLGKEVRKKGKFISSESRSEWTVKHKKKEGKLTLFLEQDGIIKQDIHLDRLKRDEKRVVKNKTYLEFVEVLKTKKKGVYPDVVSIPNRIELTKILNENDYQNVDFRIYLSFYDIFDNYHEDYLSSNEITYNVKDKKFNIY